MWLTRSGTMKAAVTGDYGYACRKEKLWPHIREFADRGIALAKDKLHALAEAGSPCELYTVHGHYADAGEVASLMASTLGVDMVMTGHSLGRNKLEHLLASGVLLINGDFSLLLLSHGRLQEAAASCPKLGKIVYVPPIPLMLVQSRCRDIAGTATWMALHMLRRSGCILRGLGQVAECMFRT